MAALPPNPYAPPGGLDAPAASGGGYVSQRVRARQVGLLLRVCLGVAFVNVVFDMIAIGVISGNRFDEDAAEAVDMRTLVVTILGVVSFLVTMVAFGRVLVQANRNTAYLGTPVREYSPASMVWWFFVPIANLAKPYYAVRDVFCASHPRGLVGYAPNVVMNWWAAWIASTIVERIAQGAMGSVASPRDAVNALLLDIVGCVAWMVAAELARRMLIALADLQDETWINPQS